jgi:hypothetical protein
MCEFSGVFPLHLNGVAELRAYLQHYRGALLDPDIGIATQQLVNVRWVIFHVAILPPEAWDGQSVPAGCFEQIPNSPTP